MISEWKKSHDLTYDPPYYILLQLSGLSSTWVFRVLARGQDLVSMPPFVILRVGWGSVWGQGGMNVEWVHYRLKRVGRCNLEVR